MSPQLYPAGIAAAAAAAAVAFPLVGKSLYALGRGLLAEGPELVTHYYYDYYYYYY